MQPAAVADTSIYSATASRARARLAKDCRWHISFFRLARMTTAALSQQTPVRPRLHRIRFFAVKTSNATDVY